MLVNVPTTGISIQELGRAVRGLDVAAFRAQYAAAFFIRHGSSKTTPHAPMRTARAAFAEAEITGAGLDPPGDDASAMMSESTGEILIIALPIKRQASSEHPFVGIGRLEGCDIAIFDETVSKFHAYVKEQPAGTWFLQDAKSRNGTTVEGKPVAQRGAGPPTTLAFGQVVRFGSVTTTFTDAASVHALATRLARD